MCSCRELDSWTQDFVLPAVVWLSGLFNPQSFLTGEAQTQRFRDDVVCARNINTTIYFYL